MTRSGPYGHYNVDHKVDRHFFSKVYMTSECWIWTGAKQGSGTQKSRQKRAYGAINRHGRTVRAHRFAYENIVGPVPDGMELDHLCGNKACVRPDHLEPVTHAENVRRARSRGVSHS